MEQLERLERETARATEAAFYLARNAAVTRFLLDEAKAPATAQVALALDHPSDGPFLVARRDGAAVECLRRGARPRDPIVTRTQLEAVAQKHDRLKNDLPRWSGDGVFAKDATGKDQGQPGFRAMFRTLLDAGDALPRETLEALTPFLPLVFERLPALWYACDDTLRDFVKRGGERLLAERRHLQPREEEQVRRTWRLHWAVGHLQALFARAEDEVLRQAAGNIIQGAAPIRATRFGFWPVALRGLSLCGRLGPTLLTGLEHGLKAPPDTIHEALTSAHGIAFVGAAQPKYRHEIGTRLSEVFESVDERIQWLARERSLLAEALHDLVVNPDEAERHLLTQCEQLRDRDLELPPCESAMQLANTPLPLHGRVAHVLLRHGLGAFARTPIADLYPVVAEVTRSVQANATAGIDHALEAGFELLHIAVEHLARLKRSSPSSR